MADKTIVQITNELTDPTVDGYYAEVDHTILGTKKISLDNLVNDAVAELKGAKINPNGGAILNGSNDKFILEDETGIETIKLLVSDIPLTSTEQLAYLGNNYEINAVSGVLTLGSAFTNATIYINGIESTTITATTSNITITFDEVSMSGGLIGSDGTSYGAYHILDWKLFNKKLATTEIISLYETNEIPYELQGASNTELLSGWDFTSGWTENGVIVTKDADSFETTNGGGMSKRILTVGKKYKLTMAGTTTSTDMRVYQGTASSTRIFLGIVSGTFVKEIIFTASGVATPDIYLRNNNSGTTDVTTMELTQIGNVLDLQPDAVGPNGWIDRSTNEHHANSSGNPIAPLGLRDSKSVSATGETELVDTWKGARKLKGITIFNLSGGTAIVSAGSVSGGSDLIPSTSYADGSITYNGINQDNLSGLKSVFITTDQEPVFYFLFYEKV